MGSHTRGPDRVAGVASTRAHAELPLIALRHKSRPKSDGRLRVDVSVDFTAYEIRVPRLFVDLGTVVAHWYVGVESARIAVRTNGGHITASTKERRLSVRYKAGSKRTRGASSTRTDKAAVKLAPVDLSTGSQDQDRMEDIASHEASFDLDEAVVSRALEEEGGAVVWRVDRPNVASVIRDFFAMSLNLFAECTWGSPVPDGQIEAKPLLVNVYDQNRKRVSGTKAALILFYVYLKERRAWNHGLVTQTLAVDKAGTHDATPQQRNRSITGNRRHPSDDRAGRGRSGDPRRSGEPGP